MRFDTETRHRSILPLLAGALVAAYLSGFLPLARKADSLDVPLQKMWRRLAGTLGPTNSIKLDFASVTNQIAETRAALVTFENAGREGKARVKLDPDLRALINEPFQLVEYENEATRQRGVLTQLAKKQNVVLEPAVFAGFPEKTDDMKEPSLLWPELAFLDCLLTTAINAKVTTIHSVAAPSPLTNAPPTNGSRPLAELPVQIELTGPTQNVANFLQALPLHTDEIKAAGLPEAPTNKPVLFIDRLVLRKQSPEKPDEVRVSLRAVGFVLRE